MDIEQYRRCLTPTIGCTLLMLLILISANASTAYAESYFAWLTVRPEHYSSAALRSAAEVLEETYYADKSKATTQYDPTLDAARFTILPGKASVATGDQIRHNFPYVDKGNLLFYWEALAPSYWSRDGDVDGIETYKAFQLSRDGDLALELRYRFKQVNTPYVARVDARVYGNKVGVEIGPGDSAAPQTGEFQTRPNVWVKHWAFVDFDNNRFSYWVGDEQRATVRILNAIPFNWRANYGERYGFNQFWFEFNTSQKRSPDPSAYIYGRNLVILRDVSNVDDIVARGNAGNVDTTRPSAPRNLHTIN